MILLEHDPSPEHADKDQFKLQLTRKELKTLMSAYEHAATKVAGRDLGFVKACCFAHQRLADELRSLNMARENQE